MFRAKGHGVEGLWFRNRSSFFLGMGVGPRVLLL